MKLPLVTRHYDATRRECFFHSNDIGYPKLQPFAPGLTDIVADDHHL